MTNRAHKCIMMDRLSAGHFLYHFYHLLNVLRNGFFIHAQHHDIAHPHGYEDLFCTALSHGRRHLGTDLPEHGIGEGYAYRSAYDVRPAAVVDDRVLTRRARRGARLQHGRRRDRIGPDRYYLKVRHLRP